MFFSHRRSCCCEECVPTKCIYSIDGGVQNCNTCEIGENCNDCMYFSVDYSGEECPPNSSAQCTLGGFGIVVSGTFFTTDCDLSGISGNICNLQPA